MNVSKLKAVLQGTGAVVKKTMVADGQDPFVLYDRNYRLKTRTFFFSASVKEFFAGKKIVAMDAVNEDYGFWTVKYWIHSDKVTESELGK